MGIITGRWMSQAFSTGSPMTKFPWIVALLVVAGCSGGPKRFEAPQVDTNMAAAKAIELYDGDGDGALSDQELARAPGMLGKIALYDQNKNGSIEEREISAHLSRLLNHTGGAQLNALILYKGKPLSGATVEMEPEPYLGDGIQTARGVTDAAGSADLAIPPEFAPENLRRLKMVHYGTFKVRITHPTISIPAKYNAETTLGYETEPGRATVDFRLN
jgi:hypothetical protein